MAAKQRQTESGNGTWIPCPACGERHRGLEEYAPFELENSGVDIECECGAKLRLTCRVMVTHFLTEAPTE